MITQTCVGECDLGERHHKTFMHKVTSERVGATSHYGWLVSMYYIYMHIHASVSVNLEACNGHALQWMPKTCSYLLEESEVC